VAKAKPKAPSGTPKVNPKLIAHLVPVAKLHVDPENARRHPPKNLQAIADLLADVGQQTTIIVDPKGRIIKGNGTFVAATTILGWKKIAAIVFDGDARAARRYGIGDNRTGELAEWEFEVLSGLARAELEAGGVLAGWDAHELEPLLQAQWKPPGASNDEKFEAGERKHSEHRNHLFAEFSPDQQEIVVAALNKVRKRHGADLSNEKALVLLCQSA